MPTLTHQVFLHFMDYKDPRIVCRQLVNIHNINYCECTAKAAFCQLTEPNMLSEIYDTLSTYLGRTFLIDSNLSHETRIQMLRKQLKGATHVMKRQNPLSCYKYCS